MSSAPPISGREHRSKPLCSPSEVAAAVRIVLAPGAVTELRALEATTASERFPHTASGYFDDADKLVEALAGIRSAKGIYLIPNVVDPTLLSRAANRLRKTPKGESTADTNIKCRRWLLVDCDPQRASGISATDSEHVAAIKRAQEVELYLHDEGWPDPIAADSGNGAHLLYRIDLPAEDGGLVKRVLHALAERFDDDAVKIDKSVFNPARIWKLYGTLTCKGDDTPERPHRISKITATPEQPQVVSRAQLEAIAGPEPSAPAKFERLNGQSHSTTVDAFDVAAFIARHNLDVDGPTPWTGQQGSGKRWIFRTSPMCDHHEDGPYIVQHASGAITAGCHHNSCGWTWQELRSQFEPKALATAVDNSPGAEAARQQSSDDENPYRRKVAYQRITSRELASASYAIDFIIENMLAKGQPLIIAGPQKVLKTWFIIDAAVALACGGFFLGKFRVPRPCRVAVMSGESGLATIQENALLVCNAARQWLEELDNLIWTPDLPKFGDPAHLVALEQFLLADSIEVLFVDPAYLAMPGADAGNLMIQGELLRSVGDLCQRLGVTMVLAHHTKKTTGRDPYDVPELSDIAWSGFAEFGRQWWLLNRREKYEPGTGQHKLWLSVGGSAGHGGLWAVDVDEGVRSDPEGRRWQVSVTSALEARDDAEQRKLDTKAQFQAGQLEGDVQAIKSVLAAMPREEGTKTDLKDQTGLYQSRFAAALAAALKAGGITQTRILKANKQTYDGYKLHHPDTPG
jgi:hypothetical protein